MKEQPVLFRPHPGPQLFSLSRPEHEILLGGARGGGKTSASVAFFSRWFHHPKYRFLVLRRNAGDLKQWIERARDMWRGFNPTWLVNEVRFPSGAIGVFGHLHDADSYERYMGMEFSRVGIEELTHIPTLDLYLRLLGSLRSTIPEIPPQAFLTTNPGGPGHSWVKERFVTIGPPNTPYTDSQGNTRIFIPALVEDNPTIMQTDPRYVKWLESLPENLKKAWRFGSWDDFEVEGAYYANEIAELNRDGRVIDQFLINYNAPVDTYWDLGMGDKTAIWFAQREGAYLNIVDYFEAEGEGLAFYADILRKKKYKYGNHNFPADMRVRELGTGKSRLEMAERLGITPLSIVPSLSLEDGIQAVRANFKFMRFDRTNCEVGLNHLKMYRKERDEERAVWKNKPRHDESSHAADAMRR